MSDAKPTIRSKGSGDSNGNGIESVNDKPLSQQLIDTLEHETDLNLTEGPPIQHHVDLDALDDLYPDESSDEVELPVVTLWFRECEITIRSRNDITIEQ